MAFNSPQVLLSGCVGFGEEYTRIKGFSNADVGAICLKGAHPQTPSWVITRIGWRRHTWAC